MMRFPLRLTADLIMAQLAKKLRGPAAVSPVLYMDPMEHARPSGHDAGKSPAKTNAGTDLLACVRSTAAPVVWIGGEEPLLHPEMGQLTRCIAGIGRHVFLETDGALLRRRIHEFRPASRLFLTVQLNGFEESHDLRAGRAGSFRAAVEGIRVAKLSGFLFCVHARIHSATNLKEIAGLIQFAQTLGVDGFVISPANAVSGTANRDPRALHGKTLEARKLIGNPSWERFSRLLDPALNGESRSRQRSSESGRSIARAEETEQESIRIT
jgi:MoaA/NifB/PqqE/SkfB family radical SAM enzyme